jgi:hypothetical protein
MLYYGLNTIGLVVCQLNMADSELHMSFLLEENSV